MKLCKRLAAAGVVGAVAAILAAVAIVVVVPIEFRVPPELAERVRAEQIADARTDSFRLATRLVPLSMLIAWFASWLSSDRTNHEAVRAEPALDDGRLGGRPMLIAKLATWLSACIVASFACLITVSIMVTHEWPRSLAFATSVAVLAFVLVLPLSSGAGVRLSSRGSKLFAVNVGLLWTWGLFMAAVAMRLMRLG
jgi:hypothetical protein